MDDDVANQLYCNMLQKKQTFISLPISKNLLFKFKVLLPSTDKEYVAEIIRKQVIELKRERLVQRAKEAKMNFKKGVVKSGGIKELLEDLESD